jgi:hypothetical protein
MILKLGSHKVLTSRSVPSRPIAAVEFEIP